MAAVLRVGRRRDFRYLDTCDPVVGYADFLSGAMRKVEAASAHIRAAVVDANVYGAAIVGIFYLHH